MRFWFDTAEADHPSEEIPSARVTQAYIFRMVYHSWRKVRYYEGLGEFEIARAQRTVLHDRARWAAKQREIARGWGLRID